MKIQMSPTRTTTLKLLRLGSVALFAIVIGIYAAWRSYDYVRGPKIIIASPTDWSSIDSTTTEIVGTALRVKEISLNGMPILVNEEGKFSEKIILFPGMNFMTISVKDQFGRDMSKRLQIYRP